MRIAREPGSLAVETPLPAGTVMQRLQLYGGWIRTCGVELPGIRTMLPSAVRSVMTCTQRNQGQLLL